MIRWLKKLLCKLNIHWTVFEGGGGHFGDDLLTCDYCTQEKYPEVFSGFIVHTIQR